MTRIEPRDVQHLTFCRKGAAALKVDDGTPIRRNHSNLLRCYFVTIRLGAGGGAAAGEMTNVSQVFQPEGRSEAPNSA